MITYAKIANHKEMKEFLVSFALKSLILMTTKPIAILIIKFKIKDKAKIILKVVIHINLAIQTKLTLIINMNK